MPNLDDLISAAMKRKQLHLASLQEMDQGYVESAIRQDFPELYPLLRVHFAADEHEPRMTEATFDFDGQTWALRLLRNADGQGPLWFLSYSDEVDQQQRYEFLLRDNAQQSLLEVMGEYRLSHPRDYFAKSH